MAPKQVSKAQHDTPPPATDSNASASNVDPRHGHGFLGPPLTPSKRHHPNLIDLTSSPATVPISPSGITGLSNGLARPTPRRVRSAAGPAKKKARHEAQPESEYGGEEDVESDSDGVVHEEEGDDASDQDLEEEQEDEGGLWVEEDADLSSANAKQLRERDDTLEEALKNALKRDRKARDLWAVHIARRDYPRASKAARDLAYKVVKRLKVDIVHESRGVYAVENGLLAPTMVFQGAFRAILMEETFDDEYGAGRQVFEMVVAIMFEKTSSRVIQMWKEYANGHEPLDLTSIMPELPPARPAHGVAGLYVRKCHISSPYVGIAVNLGDRQQGHDRQSGVNRKQRAMSERYPQNRWDARILLNLGATKLCDVPRAFLYVWESSYIAAARLTTCADSSQVNVTDYVPLYKSSHLRLARKGRLARVERPLIECWTELHRMWRNTKGQMEAQLRGDFVDQGFRPLPIIGSEFGSASIFEARFLKPYAAAARLGPTAFRRRLFLTRPALDDKGELREESWSPELEAVKRAMPIPPNAFMLEGVGRETDLCLQFPFAPLTGPSGIDTDRTFPGDFRWASTKARSFPPPSEDELSHVEKLGLELLGNMIKRGTWEWKRGQAGPSSG